MCLHIIDSWIEIPSRPSSSLSSAEHNDGLTAGLQVRRDQDIRRSRHLRLSNLARETALPSRSASAEGSSQDEYEESESESDRVLSSSNEDISQGEDEDDTSTALGVGAIDKNVFTPQPNAFTHPPTSGNARSLPTNAPDSYFAHVPPPSGPASTRLPSNRIPPRPIPRLSAREPQRQPDHDAVLRASLTTLLSCAAAVRSSAPKEREREEVAIRRPAQPAGLRLIPESELDASTVRRPRSPPPPKVAAKRRSRESSKERQAKKIRALKAATHEELISPTLVTWMISAGVVLVFSAISFSAGYAWGKEVGRIEGEMGISSGSCGREALKSGGGLRRLRFSAASPSVRA